MTDAQEKTWFCHDCRGDLALEGRVGFRESCHHCEADLHACLNCELYDPGAHNNCREPTADYVSDTAKRNFCGHFSFISGERAGEEAKDSALSALDALFK
jgi:hypothetical protein